MIGAEERSGGDVVESLSVLSFKGSGHGAEDFAGTHFPIPSGGGSTDTTNLHSKVESLVEVDSGEGGDTTKHDGEETVRDLDPVDGSAGFGPESGGGGDDVGGEKPEAHVV